LANALACSLKRSTTKKDQSAPNMAKTNPAIRLIVLAQRESKASIWLSVQGVDGIEARNTLAGESASRPNDRIFWA
jgi:hypothetical protein